MVTENLLPNGAESAKNNRQKNVKNLQTVVLFCTVCLKTGPTRKNLTSSGMRHIYFTVTHIAVSHSGVDNVSFSCRSFHKDIHVFHSNALVTIKKRRMLRKVIK